MRVVFISGEYPPEIGGVADYTMHLSHALADRGHEVSVVTSAKTANAPRTQCDGTVRVHATGHWGATHAAATARAIRALRPDVINFQYVPQMYGRAGVAPGAALLPLCSVHSRLTCLCSPAVVSVTFARPATHERAV